MKTFGEYIRAGREARGLLLREVAAAMKVDPSFLSRIESGAKRPTREQVVEIARILGEDRTKLLVLYLTERVMYELEGEEDLAMEAVMAAEKRIRYNKGRGKRRGGARRATD